MGPGLALLDGLAIALAAVLCLALVGPALYACWRPGASTRDYADRHDEAASPVASDFEEIVAGLIDPTPLPRTWRPEASERRFGDPVADRQPSSTEH